MNKFLILTILAMVAVENLNAMQDNSDKSLNNNENITRDRTPKRLKKNNGKFVRCQVPKTDIAEDNDTTMENVTESGMSVQDICGVLSMMSLGDIPKENFKEFIVQHLKSEQTTLKSSISFVSTQVKHHKK